MKDIEGIVESTLKTTNKITYQIKDEELIFTIENMDLKEIVEDEKHKIRRRIRDLFILKLKEIGKENTYDRKQIHIEFKSGSVIIIVKIISLEEVKQIDATGQGSNKSVKNKNYIQYKPKGRNGLFIPMTEIGDTDGELNKLFQDSSNVGGMALN